MTKKILNKIAVARDELSNTGDIRDLLHGLASKIIQTDLNNTLTKDANYLQAQSNDALSRQEHIKDIAYHSEETVPFS